MRTGLAWTLTACLAAGMACAEGPRPTEPVLLADFETTESVALWQGIEYGQTDERASSGEHALTFSVPKYEKGQEERPGVRLAFDGGNGFPFQDFSRYGSIVADVWVVGDGPGKLGLKLRDADGEDSWTTHITVEPGRWNPAELLIADAGADVDTTRIDEIVLYALRPETGFTLIVDNIRLLPADAPPLATFTLRYPNYRGLIFPDGGDVEVAVTVEAEEYGLDPRSLVLGVTLSGGDQKVRKAVRLRGPTGAIALSPAELPDGPVKLDAVLFRPPEGLERVARRVRNVEKVFSDAPRIVWLEAASASWPLKKASAETQASLKVYIDRANNLIVDGEPFFPLGWYGNSREDYLLEIADSPFNTLLAYGTDHVRKEDMLRFLDLMDEKGMKLVYCMNDVYPTATYFEGKDWEGVEGNDAIAAAVVEAYKDHPAVLAWYLNDELPRKLVPDLTEYYERVRRADPNHPCFIVLCNRSELPYFPHTTDILGVDPYPIPKGPITEVNKFTDAAHAAVQGLKPVWQVPQAFGWYQYNSENKDRGHIPTEEELKNGRAPSFEEERCMTYLALTHGAKGLIYYCYYDLRVLPQYEEMWGWMKRIGEEVKTLSPVLLSPDDLGTVAYASAEAPIHTKLKRHDGRLYLLAVNAAKSPEEVVFELPQRLSGSAEVLFEDRRVEAEGKRLRDGFAPLEAHVYDLGPTR